MSDDASYGANYVPDRLYVNPTRQHGVGAYVSIARDDEEIIGEIEVTERSRVVLSAFYHSEKGDFKTFKITKIKFHKTYGWHEDGHIHVNNFQLAQIAEFNALLKGLNLSDAKKD